MKQGLVELSGNNIQENIDQKQSIQNKYVDIGMDPNNLEQIMKSSNSKSDIDPFLRID